MFRFGPYLVPLVVRSRMPELHMHTYTRLHTDDLAKQTIAQLHIFSAYAGV